MTSMLASPSIVAGAGCTELHLAHYIRSLSTSTNRNTTNENHKDGTRYGGYYKLVYENIALALEGVVVALYQLDHVTSSTESDDVNILDKLYTLHVDTLAFNPDIFIDNEDMCDNRLMMKLYGWDILRDTSHVILAISKRLYKGIEDKELNDSDSSNSNGIDGRECEGVVESVHNISMNNTPYLLETAILLGNNSNTNNELILDSADVTMNYICMAFDIANVLLRIRGTVKDQ